MFVEFQIVQSARGPESYCLVCEERVPYYEEHLKHCTRCGEHHTTEISCRDVKAIHDAEDKAWDPNP